MEKDEMKDRDCLMRRFSIGNVVERMSGCIGPDRPLRPPPYTARGRKMEAKRPHSRWTVALCACVVEDALS